MSLFAKMFVLEFDGEEYVQRDILDLKHKEIQ